jgi:molecular chaperone IbpA
MTGLDERSGQRLQIRAAAQMTIATLLLKEDTMRHFDFSPLYRSTVGFDRVFTMLDSLAQPEQQTYPPYNIEKTGDNAYRISMAVAGFDETELSIELNQHLLTVKGERPTKRTKTATCFIAALPSAPSSAASSLPTMSKCVPLT